LKKYESEIDSLLDNKGTITHKDLRDMSGINKSQSAQIIRALVSRNLIEQAPELGKGCYKRAK
jgi:predicted HTH transcriptional regulator